MSAKAIKQPGSDHLITIERNPAQIIVAVHGKVVAETTRALTLREASYTPVHYVPRDDVDMSAMRRTDHTSYCPYKGDAAYFTVATTSGEVVNAAWTYEDTFLAVAAIKDHVAFYSERVDISVG